jgi:phosphohistidine swiveling domain-containing protein
MRYTIQLSEVSSKDRLIAGGKASNIGEITEMGLQIPGGFCITTEAYDGFMTKERLREQIDKVLTSADLSSLQASEIAYKEISELILKKSVHPSLSQEIAQAYQDLGHPPVAVRSSATTEDQLGYSFAGQHDTFLNITSNKSLMESVKLVWASTFSARAIYYRNRRGLNHHDVRMAVAVQEMVPAIASGVMFTTNHIGPKKDILLINSVFGLAEPLVSGDITPDSFLVDKKTLLITEKTLGRKDFQISAATGGGSKRSMTPARNRTRFSLSHDDVSKLARLGQKLEEHFGSPQDVEWAYHSGEFYLLQSRPLVSMGPPESVNWDNPVPGARWRRNWRLGEWLSDPVTPLFSTTVLPWLVAGREMQGFGHLGWRAGKSFQMPQPWSVIVNGYFFTRQDVPFRPGVIGADPISRAAALVKRHRWLARWHKHHLPKYLQYFRPLLDLNLAVTDSKRLLQMLERLAKDAGELWYVLAPIGFGFEESFFVPFYDQYLNNSDRPHYSVFFSGYDSRLLQGQRILYQIARDIRKDSHLSDLLQGEPLEILRRLPDSRKGEILLSRLNSYLEEYGHQVYSIDLYFPTLGERPDLLVQVIQNYLSKELLDIDSALASQSYKRQQASTWILNTAKKSIPDKAVAFRKMLKWHQLCAMVREDATFYFQIGWPIMRNIVKELESRLLKYGLIDRPNQIFFLEKQDLAYGIAQMDSSNTPSMNLSEIATRREIQWRDQRTLYPPDRIPKEDDPAWHGSPIASKQTGLVQDAHGARLAGLQASPGRKTGRARIITSPDDFGDLKHGDILVTVATNPAWTPLFPMVSAIVTEVGGGATHCSLVAREYGIPCVMGTGVATQVIQNGQLITVDGNEGIVYL